MKIGVAQLNSRVGDLGGNAAAIARAVDQAASQGADLVVTPELALCGYPPRDLLLDPAFVAATLAQTLRLAHELRHAPPVLLGTLAQGTKPGPQHPGLLNAAVLIVKGRIVATYGKQLLPAYDVFYEPRWFVPDEPREPVGIGDVRIGVLVCEDLWDEEYPRHPPAELVRRGANVLICLSASPYRKGITAQRLHQARRAARLGVPVVYVNSVGAQDELIFDGGSFLCLPNGQVADRLPRFAEQVGCFSVDHAGASTPGIATGGADTDPSDPLRQVSVAEELTHALTLGIQDFCRKNGVRRAFVGVSGGIDSAVVLCLATAALGAANITGLALPSRHNDPRSLGSAQALCDQLGVRLEVLEIEPYLLLAERALVPRLDPTPGKAERRPPDTSLENLQARVRAMILMAFVNRHGGILLNTSNKTELSVGYSTLYGDMAGTLGVLADLTKPEVYAIAHVLNAQAIARGQSAPIPAFVIERPPSAELRPAQVDPFDYAAESPVIDALVTGGTALPPAHEAQRRFHAMIRSAEHKRWQFGVVLKVSERAFGSGRMMPITRA